MSTIPKIQLERGPHGEKDPNDYRDDPEKFRKKVNEQIDRGEESAPPAQQTPNAGKQATEPDLNEEDLALRFTDENPNLRYVAQLGQWLRYEKPRWQEDHTLAVFDLVRKLVRNASEGMKNPARLRRANTVAAVERLAKADRRHAATVDLWDRGDWKLNTPAGIVDLKAGALLPHTPDGYHTKITATAPGGACPLWDGFLDKVTDSDRELIEFLQRMAGYALTGSTREHALFFLYGTGANGKGVFLNTLTGVMGDYAAVSPMAVFTESRHDRHPTELAMLRGARMVTAQETEEGRRWAESRIKVLTGGDLVTARYMRQDFFTFEPKFKLLIAGNHKPSLRNVDEAMRRRLHLVPFIVTIPKANRDPDLTDRLKEEWPGILRWVTDGCLAYQREGLNPPEAVRGATDEYFNAEDFFAQWLEDCCERGPGFYARPALLFGSWKMYAEAANEWTGTQKALWSKIEQAGFNRAKSTKYGGRAYLGIRLKQEQTDDIQAQYWDEK